MTFESGDRWQATGGNPSGRPRSLDTELARLREAAAQIDRIIEGQVLGALLEGRGGEAATAAINPRLLDLSAVLTRKVVEAEGLANAVAQLVPAKRGRRRRKRHPNGTPVLHHSSYSRDVATAAILLDRLVPLPDGETVQ